MECFSAFEEEICQNSLPKSEGWDSSLGFFCFFSLSLYVSESKEEESVI